MLKIKLMIAGAVLLLAAGGGLWMYINHLQSENEILTVNAAQLDDALAREKQSTATLMADAKFKDDQLQDRMSQLQQLQQINSQLTENLRGTETQPTLDCLATVPSNDFIRRLREHSEGQGRDRSDAVVPEPGVLPE